MAYPTDRTLFFRTDSTTGGDGTEDRTDGSTRAFESLDAALDYVVDTDADLTGQGPLTLRCTQAGEDTGGCTTTGITTTASDYLVIECTGSARCNGVSYDQNGNTSYRKSHSFQSINNYCEYFRLKGMELHSSASGIPPYQDYVTSASSDIRIDECLFINENATVSGNYTFDAAGSSSANIAVTNCLLIANGMRGFHCNQGSMTLDHCGAMVDGIYAYTPDGSTTITNCWGIHDTGGEDFWTGGSAPTGSHNASLDNSAATDFTSTVDIVAAANEFTSPSTNHVTADFTLKDSLLNEAGTGSEGVDITGAARTGTPDIGPFNYSAGGIIQQAMHHYRHNIGN